MNKICTTYRTKVIDTGQLQKADTYLLGAQYRYARSIAKYSQICKKYSLGFETGQTYGYGLI